jgi:integrating conjugative element protein (TIGR03752 family)
VPRNATLVGARGFTALVGRIPVRGQVVDPFPFKVLVGANNLAANGIVMPELFGMVFSGRAVGDWTLSCVRGELFSVTYVFEDGSIQSYPEGDTEVQETRPMGWISDPYGIPCVNGERKTNAQSFLSQRIGLSAASAAAEAAAAAETATTVSGATGTATSAVTGDIDTFIRNRTVSEGIDEISRWLDERQAQSFDAIYVAPDSELVVHVTREFAIDLDRNGRKVNHDVISQRPASRSLD